MKRFCFKMSGFFIGLIVINLIFYHVISKPVLLKEYLMPQKDDFIKYKSMMFADSRGNAVNQKHLDKIGMYNVSYDSDNYYDIYLKLTYLIKQNTNIDIIFVSVDDHTLSRNRERTNNIDRSILYSIYPTYKVGFTNSYLEYVYRKYVRTYLPFLNTSSSELFMRYIISKILSSFSSGDNKAKMKAWEGLSGIERIKNSHERFIIFLKNYLSPEICFPNN